MSDMTRATTERPIIVLGNYVSRYTRAVSRPKPGDENLSLPKAADVHFFGVQIEGEPTSEKFAELIKNARRGEYGDVDADRIKAGPSYIELGAWIGDQGLALRFIGMGVLLGLWGLGTPEAMGFDVAQSEDLAGRGFVMIAPNAKTNEVF